MLKEKDIIVLYRDKQYSSIYIGKLFKVSHKTILRYLRVHNIRIRPRNLSTRLAKNIIGKIFGRLTVLKYDKNTRYICKCKCGTIKSIRRDALINARTLSCGCYNTDIHNKPKIWDFVRKYQRTKIATSYANYKYGAKRRILNFTLSIKDFVQLISDKCYYCGETSKKGFNGIDRKDNYKGYTLKNSVSCCDICNHAKYTMSKTQFLNKVKKIYNCSITDKKK